MKSNLNIAKPGKNISNAGLDLAGGCRGYALSPCDDAFFLIVAFKICLSHWSVTSEVHPLLRKILDPSLKCVLQKISISHTEGFIQFDPNLPDFPFQGAPWYPPSLTSWNFHDFSTLRPPPPTSPPLRNFAV